MKKIDFLQHPFTNMILVLVSVPKYLAFYEMGDLSERGLYRGAQKQYYLLISFGQYPEYITQYLP